MMLTIIDTRETCVHREVPLVRLDHAQCPKVF